MTAPARSSRWRQGSSPARASRSALTKAASRALFDEPTAAGMHVFTGDQVYAATATGIGREPGEQFACGIMEKHSIDAVSGATMTSNAANEALAQCLRQAGL